MEYKEQIRTPQWQKRRLEIMQRDNFTCQFCGDTKHTLNVHHLVYHKDKMIWEYEDWELITLCESCHQIEHSMFDVIIEKINHIRRQGVSSLEINALLDSVDISLYNEKDNIIRDIAGDNDGSFEFDTIKNLAQRRILLKKPFYLKRKQENQKLWDETK